jgi:transcriptional regulator with GAF, ATPase, and Fis domain
MSATADQQLAELRRANAELLKERDAAIAELQSRSTALAQRNTEYGERIQHQSATIDVLKVMSASPSDPQPVFQLIVQRARVLCNADNANLALVDGNSLHLQATTIQEGLADYTAQFPRPLDTTSMFGRAVLTCEAVQTTDLRADLQHFQTAMGASSVLAAIAVPLLRAGEPIGAIGLTRSKSGEFSATQLELLRTFAEQAVITVASAETYRALQTRTADLQESLEIRLRPVMCWRSLAARPSICSLSWTQWPRPQPGCVMRNRPPSTVARAI